MTRKNGLIGLVVGWLLLSTGHGVIAQEQGAKPEAPPTRLPSAPVPLRSAPKTTPEAESSAEQEELSNELPQFETGVEFKAMSPRTRVTFNIEDAELPDLVRLMRRIKRSCQCSKSMGSPSCRQVST